MEGFKDWHDVVVRVLNLNLCLIFNIRTKGLPEDQNLVSSPDAFINQVKEQNHFCRVLQNSHLVV